VFLQLIDSCFACPPFNHGRPALSVCQESLMGTNSVTPEINPRLVKSAEPVDKRYNYKTSMVWGQRVATIWETLSPKATKSKAKPQNIRANKTR